MEAENPKASLTSYKGHFTRQKRAFDRRLDEFKLHPEVAEQEMFPYFKMYLLYTIARIYRVRNVFRFANCKLVPVDHAKINTSYFSVFTLKWK